MEPVWRATIELPLAAPPGPLTRVWTGIWRSCWNSVEAAGPRHSWPLPACGYYLRARTRAPAAETSTEQSTAATVWMVLPTGRDSGLPSRPTLLALLGSSSGSVWACGPAGRPQRRRQAAKLLQDAVLVWHYRMLATQYAAISRILMTVAVRFTSCLLAVRDMTHLAHRCGYGWTALPEKKREKRTQPVAQDSVHAPSVAAVFEVCVHIRCVSLMLLKCRLRACARHIPTIPAVA